MGISEELNQTEPDAELAFLLLPTITTRKPPKDKFHVAYIIYFTLGVGYLLPWNLFVTVVDYFHYMYPSVLVDRIFTVVYMVVGLTSTLGVVFYSHKSVSFVRINVGLVLFVICLLTVPVMDAVYIKGRVGLYDGFYVSVVAVALAAVSDGLVEGSLIGVAGELPERYMQAVVAGTAGSGVLVSGLRILTKAIYPQDATGLRNSVNLDFAVGIIVMTICIFFYNITHKLPVIQYYNKLKMQAVSEDEEEKASLTGARLQSTLWEVIGNIKWHGIGIVVIYIVSFSIFPGYITEDIHSEILKDWYPILLIASYNVFDLVGKLLTAVYLLQNDKIAIGGCFARLLFYPLFLECLHGPEFFRTEISVTILTCLLGLTNGYLTSVLMILAPKVVPLQHSETAGIVTVLFLFLGLAIGSTVAWFWVI